MRLLQFSTSPFCRKVRLALGYKKIPYEIENLTVGLHRLQLKPMTGLTTVPVLLLKQAGQPEAIADSTSILHWLETYAPSLQLADPTQRRLAWVLEDWLDESLAIATRFVYYHYRLGEGRAIDPSWTSLAVIRIVCRQYGINAATADLAAKRLTLGLEELAARWQTRPTLVGDRLSVADVAAAALLSPLALIPSYRQAYPWLFDRITEVHQHCQEPLPPGLMS